MKVSTGLAQKNIMQSKALKVICLLVFVAVASLASTTPASAHSMGGMAGNHSDPCQKNSSVPLCCLSADCPLVQSVTVSPLPYPNSLTSAKTGKSASATANLIPDSSPGQARPPQKDTYTGCLGPPGPETRCRNCLLSEEPPLI